MCQKDLKNGHRLTLKTLSTHPPTMKLFLISYERYGQENTFLLQYYGTDFASIKRYDQFCLFTFVYKEAQILPHSIHTALLLFCLLFLLFLWPNLDKRHPRSNVFWLFWAWPWRMSDLVPQYVRCWIKNENRRYLVIVLSWCWRWYWSHLLSVLKYLYRNFNPSPIVEAISSSTLEAVFPTQVADVKLLIQLFFFHRRRYLQLAPALFWNWSHFLDHRTMPSILNPDPICWSWAVGHSPWRWTWSWVKGLILVNMLVTSSTP